MSLFADQDVSVSSVNGTVRISAKKELILESGGAFIQIKDGSITLGGPLDLFIKTITIQKQGKASMHLPLPPMPVPQSSGPYSLRFDLSGALADGEISGNASYLMKVGEKTRYFGTVDDDSMTGRIFTDKEEQVQLSVRNGAWSSHMDSLNDDLFADGSEAEQ
jgi:type VI secretion system secreted protein VgrG